MDVSVNDFENPLFWGVPIFLLCIAIEAYISHRENKELYEWKDTVASTWVALGASLLNISTRVATVGFFAIFFELFKPLRENYLGYSELGWAWWVWLLCVLGDDFNFYWHHRFCHTVRIFWAAHIVHHSSEKFNFGTALRNGWTIFFFKPIYWIWLPILGFHPVMVGTCLAINSTYQMFLHSRMVPSLGWFEKIFNTPWLHQVHHACNVDYLDRNHGGILIIWDKLFGTFHDNNQEPKFGVLHPPNSYNPLVLVGHEYRDIWVDVRSAKSWKDKFKYIFYAPGWSPDGSRQTAKQLQREKELQLQQQARAPISHREPALSDS